MGCSSSKLDDEEAVQLCRDRTNFIKQAVEQRYRFALGHIAYIESLRRVSLALLSFAEGNERRDFIADHFTTPPFTPVKRLSPEPVGIPLKSTSHVVNYLRPSGSNLAIPVEEWPGSPETVRVESFYSSNSYGTDGFFTYEASQMNRPRFSPALPQSPQWDFFWNPFSSLEQHAYQFTSNDDDDDEMVRLTKIREREGIPELEEDGGVEEEGEEEDDDDSDDHDDAKHQNKEDEKFGNAEMKDEIKLNPVVRPNTVSVEGDGEREKVHELKECQTQGAESMEVSEARDAAEVEAREETPGFTVYVNRRPTSMVEVVKDVESQFARIFDSAREVSVMLEASRALYSARNEITGSRMWNPVSLFHSPSSRSSSSRFLQASVASRDEGHEGDEASSNYSEECCMVSGSHQSTLERLYAWEKRLYDEVKCGERIRIAYEKKCAQLRRHDVNGEEPSVVDRTRAAIRDLHTLLTVSIHSVKSVSQRIEALRDQELCPQLVELIQGLARMWRIMADCHRIQKRTIDEAKLLLFSSSAATPPAIANMARISGSSPLKPSKYATNLVFELRNWRSCFAAWIAAQRSYARALAGWISSCAQTRINANGDDDQTAIQSPGRIGARAPPVFGLCVRWSRLLDSVTEGQVAEGIDFFARGIESVSTGPAVGPEGAVVVAEGMSTGPAVGPEGAVVVAEGMAEISERVLCAGMSAAVGALTEFAASSAEGYEELVKKFE